MDQSSNPLEAEDTGISALDTLLEAERAALLKGDLVALTEMLPDKEALIETLQTQTHRDLPVLQQLESKVQRNQVLLNGALEGMRDVSRRMAALRRMRGGLDTYGSDGTKRHIDVQVEHSVGRRS